jgi:hypothetical protein
MEHHEPGEAFPHEVEALLQEEVEGRLRDPCFAGEHHHRMDLSHNKEGGFNEVEELHVVEAKAPEEVEGANVPPVETTIQSTTWTQPKRRTSKRRSTAAMVLRKNLSPTIPSNWT